MDEQQWETRVADILGTVYDGDEPDIMLFEQALLVILNN
jgi:hypothetical protein